MRIAPFPKRAFYLPGHDPEGSVPFPRAGLQLVGDEGGNSRCVPTDVVLFQSTREAAEQQMQPATWEPLSRNWLAGSWRALGKRHRLRLAGVKGNIWWHLLSLGAA